MAQNDTDTRDRGPGATPTGAAVRLGVSMWRVGLLAAVAAGTVLEHGYPARAVPVWAAHALQALCFAVYLLDVWGGRRRGRQVLRGAGPGWGDAVLAGAGVVGVVAGVAAAGAWWFFELAAGLLLAAELWRLNVALSRWWSRPGLLLPLNFLVMIALGTLLLKVPAAVPPGQHITWLDALFTMTSAVCVTGLVVRDTATGFSPFGQAVIGLFIQLGGLTVVVFGSMLAVLLGRRLSMGERMSLSAVLNDQPVQHAVSLVRFIVLTTLLVEAAGAVALLPMWGDQVTGAQRVGLSLFHSVSAFCNAGFSLQRNGLEPYRYAPSVHLVIAPLLVAGGLGFSVLADLWRALRQRVTRRWAGAAVRVRFDLPPPAGVARLSLNTKVVLTTTAALYIVGVVVLAAGQLKPYSDLYFQQGVTANRVERPPLSLRQAGAVLADASFMSLTARTAGFNTVPMDELSPAGRFALMTLMMIGASPGSTGGGMKTTTVALLLLTVAATLRRRDQTDAFGRRVGEPLVRKAATLAACFIALVTAATLLLRFSEPYPLEKVVFEAVSAASTTGLSLGITGDLTAFGRVVIIATMFLGRVGPLALLGLLFFRPGARVPYVFAREDVLMG